MLSENLSILNAGGQKQLHIGSGEVIFIAGPNGVGKSSLLHDFFMQKFEQAEILSGHRQITFQSDDIDQIGMSLTQFYTNIKNSPEAFSRYRSAFGELHLKVFVKRAIALDAEINANIADLIRNDESATSYIARNPSVVRTVNSVFAAARMQISISIKGQITANREGVNFTIDKLSDGERAALLLVLAIVSHKKDGILIIDEPEKHLNQGIAGPLIASAIRSRPDVGFVIASHDLGLIKWLSPKEIIHLRNSAITSSSLGRRETRSYDFDILTEEDGVPDSLKEAVLGVKENILFVEGETSSDDRMLYSFIYPRLAIVPKRGWESVVGSVRVLRQSKDYSWLNVQGIVDGDGRDQIERNTLLNDGIYCVDAPTIENLFLLEPVLRIMAEQHHLLFGGKSVEERMRDAETALASLLISEKRSIIIRRSVWIVNRKISELKISFSDLMQDVRRIEAIDVAPIVEAQTDIYDIAIEQNNPFAVIERIPVKNTKIPSALAKGVGFDSFSKLKAAVFKQLDDGGPAASRILEPIKRKLPRLTY